jgi:Fe-Mn family superoxide dismutase
MNRRTLLKQTGAAASALFAGSSILGKLTPRALAQAPVQPPISLATTLSSSAPFVLPPLPYNYDALEPFIDAETMHLHHDKHHASYVEKLNAVVASDASLSHHSLKSLLANLSSIPEPVRTSVRNQAGGHANHSFWWPTLGKSGSRVPQGELAADINSKFGSFPAFQDQFAKAASSVFGSGWAWLNLDSDGGLHIETTANQDSPLTTFKTPVLGIDVWEHAYYLKYQNRRADYLKGFFSIVNWDYVTTEYTKAKDCCKVPKGPSIS